MEKIVTVGLSQYPILPLSDSTNWIAHTKQWFEEAVNKHAKILVFPEYASLNLISLIENYSSLSLNEQIDKMQSKLDLLENTFSDLCKTYNVCAIAPSVPVKASSSYVNQAWVFGRNGIKHSQSKLHMTRFESEIWGISPGSSTVSVFDLDGIKFGVQICFDIEFSSASAVIAKHGAHAIFAPSCTETLAGLHRVHVGARARALENQLYVGVSQTIGEALWCEAIDQNTGKAALYGPPDLGFPEDGIICTGDLNKPKWLIAELDLNLIDQVRKRGSVFNHKHNQQDFMNMDWIKANHIQL